MLHFAALAIASLVTSTSGIETVLTTGPAAKACQLLQGAFPELVAFPDSEQYEADIEHWAITSTQSATCSIEPETADDVSEILKIIGRADVRAPFAVKGGGHAFYAGASSTTGVQISMARFNGVEYNAESGTITLGTGLIWDDVYRRLDPFGVTVAGGRTSGVGVSGLSLGGGYSWISNQYGLTIDTIVSHNVVLPSGEQVRASDSSHPDLFFGLRGGLNNFGIVTNITYEAFPQTLVYGGMILYAQDVAEAVNSAIDEFSVKNTDPKAQMFADYNATAGQLEIAVHFLYDGPAAPAGIFDSFLSIPAKTSSVSTQTFADFFAIGGSFDLGYEPHGIASHVIPITVWTADLLSKAASEAIAVGEKLTAANNELRVNVIVVPEPFLDFASHSRGGAYPHSPSRQVTPTNPIIIYEINPNWTEDEHSAFNDLVVASLKDLCHNVQAEAVAQGLSRWDDILYPNYALGDTPLELMYGTNIPKLREIAKKYDPNGVMKLTGGPHF